MHIKKVVVSDYKRFADLTIQNIPDTASIVILAGPNGSGKSSLFDAFLTWFGANTPRGGNHDPSYHDRPGSTTPPNAYASRVEIEFYETMPSDLQQRRNMFYFRSAYRNDPDFSSSSVERAQDVLTERRFNRMIEVDTSVSGNYKRIVAQTLEETLVTEDGSMTLAQYREKVRGDIRRSVINIFPDLKFTDVGNPLDNGSFFFDKGGVSRFPYKNLSGGEKAAFDLVLDLIVKRKVYNDTIFCIDEPEAHLNARVQSDVLAELHRLIPPGSQLWLATHSIGMMRKARELALASPGSVVFLDFGEHDFDSSVVLEPVRPTRAFWERALSVAVADMADLVAPKQVVICEGNPAGPVPGKNDQLDADCYNEIFAEAFPDTKFLSAGNAHDVVSDRLKFVAAISALVKGITVERLIDRDDHSLADIQRFNAAGLRVLSWRNMESYLFHDDVLIALCAHFNQSTMAPNLLAAKQTAMAAAHGRGKPVDDVKPARDDIYVAAKNLLRLTSVGNDSAAFMRQILAPLVTTVPFVYSQLRSDIFGS